MVIRFFFTVQRHTTNNQSFDQDWDTYAAGFGSPDADHWLGNDVLHAFTSQEDYKLRMDFESYTFDVQKFKYAFKNITYSYDTFIVAEEKENYR